MTRNKDHLPALFFISLSVTIMLILMSLPGCTLPAQSPEADKNAVLIEKQPEPNSEVTQADDSCCRASWGTSQKAVHKDVKGTGYYPDSSALEGGFKDRYGAPLQTLQGFLSGKHKYVAVALDKNLGKVKRKLCSPQLNRHFGKAIPLYAVDTGGAFTGKGWTRVDTCVASRKDSVDAALNGRFDLVECAE